MTRAIAYIDEEGAKYGYYMKRNKGTYLLGRCGSYERASQKKQYLVDRFGFDERLIHIHPSDILLAYGPGDSYSLSCRGYGAKVLRTWVGHSDLIKSSLQEKLVELRQERDSIIRFKDPQVRNWMFRWCSAND
jgi:hypothetical protein